MSSLMISLTDNAGALFDHLDNDGERGGATEFRIGRFPLIEHGTHDGIGNVQTLRFLGA